MNAQPARESPPPEHLLIGERNILEQIATGAGLHDVLDSLCRVIDEQSGLTSSVYVVDRSGRQLLLTAGPHLPDDLRERARLIAVAPTNTSCGAAVSTRQQVIVTDVATSPLYTEWREVLRAARIASVWSTPFFSKDNHVLGTFAVFCDEPRHPDDAQLRLVDRATHLASIALERHQTEDGLRESERRFSAAFYASPACMTIHRFADGRFLYVNDTFETVFGYSRAEAVGQSALSLGIWADPSQRSALVRLLNEHDTVRDFEAKARTKSGDLIDVLVSTARIQILGEACLLGIIYDITDRKRIEEALAENERLLKLVLDALPVGLAVVNLAGDVVLSNPASRRIWGELISSGPERYAKSKGWWHDSGMTIEPREWSSVRALATGEAVINDVIDIEAFDGVRKVIQNSAVPIHDTSGRTTGAVIVNDDISARMTAERELQDSVIQMRALTGRLMREQDDERRRIAQMLHDTVAQDLAVLKMHLARVTRTEADLSEDDRAALTESVDLAERSMTGIRTLSYLLHPPFLDESGLVSALRWYAEGFAERSGINVDLDLPSVFERLPQDVETALFRVVQEALINIHHHADSASALIRLRADGRQLTLEIEDRGRGLPPKLLEQLPTGGGALGVGVVGMRARLQQLGGTLEIASTPVGTVVRARIPLASDRP